MTTFVMMPAAIFILIPLVIPLAMAAIGAGTSIAGALKAKKGSQYLRGLIKDLPEPKASEAISTLVGETKMASNVNPLLAQMQQKQQQDLANAEYMGLKSAKSPAAAQAFISDIYGQQQRAALEASIQGEALKAQNKSAYYNALGMKGQDEARLYNEQVNKLMSKANLASAAYQGEAQALAGIGNQFTSMAGTMMGSGKMSNSLFKFQ